MKRAFMVVVGAALAAGCVSSTKYKAGLAREQGLRTQLSARQGELDQAKKDLAAAKAEVAELTTKLASSEQQVASLKGSVADLQQSAESSKSELQKKLSAIVTEKDEAAQKLAEAQARAAELDKQVAAALADKAALEKAKEDELAKAKQNYQDLAAGLKAEIADGAVKLTQLKDKLSVQLVDKILFDSGSAELKPGGRKVLSQIGGLLNKMPGKDLRIEGYTDNVPISAELRGRYPSNWELSTARATSVARFLQEQAGVDPQRLIAAGYGENRPVAANDTPEGRAQNRRIEIVLVNQD